MRGRLPGDHTALGFMDLLMVFLFTLEYCRVRD